MSFELQIDFKSADEYNKNSRDLPGFIVELTSLTSKHTSFAFLFDVKASEKAILKPFQTALCHL